MKDFNITELVGKTILVIPKTACSICRINTDGCEAKQILDITVNKKVILVSSNGRGAVWITVERFTSDWTIIDVTKGQVKNIEDVISEDGVGAESGVGGDVGDDIEDVVS